MKRECFKMKRKKCMVLGVAFVTVGLLLTGCGETPEETDSSVMETATSVTEAETTVVTTTVTTEKITTEAAATSVKENWKVIGEQTESETAFVVYLTNATDQTITGVSVKEKEEKTFSENMMKEKEVFAVGEECILYYEPDTDIKQAEYTIQLTFLDGTTAELHAFPFGEMEQGEIKQEKNVVYLLYTSNKDQKKVSTKEAELAFLAEQEETSAVEESEQEEEFEEIDDDIVIPDENDPVVDVPEESSAVEETPTEGNDPNNGCIGDEGLFY